VIAAPTKETDFLPAPRRGVEGALVAKGALPNFLFGHIALSERKRTEKKERALPAQRVARHAAPSQGLSIPFHSERKGRIRQPGPGVLRFSQFGLYFQNV
jgi:hypothetical protein